MQMTCHHCRRKIQFKAELAGRKARCPNPECRSALTLIHEIPSFIGTPDANPKVVDHQKTSAQVMGNSEKTAPYKTAAKQVPVKRSHLSGGFYSKRSERTLGGTGVAITLLGCLYWMNSQTTTKAIAQAPTLPAHPQFSIPADPGSPDADYQLDLAPFIMTYCADCHSQGSQLGDFAHDHYSTASDIKKDRRVWTKVLKLIKVGAMPPADSSVPEAEELQKAIDWLEHELFYLDCNLPQDPGRVTVRRLNKNEYNNTIRDLLYVDFKPGENFPSDDVGHGFDNIGDVLTIPPLLMEKYLDAAEAITAKAVSPHGPNYFNTILAANQLENRGSVNDDEYGKAFHSNGHVIYNAEIPRDGLYRLKFLARQDKAGDEEAKMRIDFGEEFREVAEVKSVDSYEPITYEMTLKGGRQQLRIAFTNDYWNPEAEYGRDRNAFIQNVQIEGPLEMTEEERKTASILRNMPSETLSAVDAVRANLTNFLPRAFRRPVTATEIDNYVELAKSVLADGQSFEDTMAICVQAILISPDFLFLMEDSYRNDGHMEMLNDYALASRLSYFLWSSLPDEELFDLAAQNRLHEPQVLREQTDRMLKDPKAQALIANFPGQWLGLRKLTTNDVDPNPNLYPDFNNDIRLDLWKETETFFGSIVRDDASIYDLLNGKYTYVNQRLAEYYGYAGVEGEEFRRIDLANYPRAGVLTQGSILTLTSFPDRTSPVRRGEWVLANIFGDPPPEAPPSVPAIDADGEAGKDLTFRERLERHRSDPACAACHREMDAIGFGMQTFDAIGRFRTEESGKPVDASGVLPNGEAFNGAIELIDVLSKDRTKFGRCLTEKMLTYSLGRGVDWYDACAVEKILGKLEHNERMSTLIHGIVESEPFLARRALKPETTVSAVE